MYIYITSKVDNHFRDSKVSSPRNQQQHIYIHIQKPATREKARNLFPIKQDFIWHPVHPTKITWE